MISIKQLSKSYQDANETYTVLHDLSINIEPASSLSIQGASGSGKSTLLHILAALDKPHSGQVLLGHEYIQRMSSIGIPISMPVNETTDVNQQLLNMSDFSESHADHYRKKCIGMIFQKFNLIDCISVFENIVLPAKLNKNIDLDYINTLAESLDIRKHFNKQTNELSGGEQQRVAIARGLAHKPLLLLADEPTGNLDSNNSDIVSNLLIDTCKALQTTLVMVTHSEKVASLTQRQFLLSKGQLQELPSNSDAPSVSKN